MTGALPSSAIALRSRNPFPDLFPLDLKLEHCAPVHRPHLACLMLQPPATLADFWQHQCRSDALPFRRHRVTTDHRALIAAEVGSIFFWTRAPVQLHFLDATCAAFVRGSTLTGTRRPPPIPLWQEFAGSPAIETLPLPYGGASQSRLDHCLCYETLCAMPR
jgi:hypothetical protein